MITREQLLKAIEQSQMVRIDSCCGIEEKFCSSDEWVGNLEAFSNAVLKIVNQERSDNPYEVWQGHNTEIVS